MPKKAKGGAALKPRKPPGVAPAVADDFVSGAEPAPAKKSKGGRPPKEVPAEGIVQTTIRLPKDAHRAIRKACIDREVDLSSFVLELCRRELGF